MGTCSPRTPHCEDCWRRDFATVVPQKARLLLYLHVDPDQVSPLPSNGRNVRQQGHRGTGDLELAIAAQADLDAAKPLILMAYEGRAALAMPSSDASR